MSAERQLNPSEFSAEQLDRIAFALIGKMSKIGIVEKPLNREEAAAFIGYSVATLDRFVEKGLITPMEIQPGSDARFLPSKLLAAFKQRKV